MDLSALIFVALAVAWGAYLIPKALKHADDVGRTRSIERFSASLRVLARREPVTSSEGRLVVKPGAPATGSSMSTSRVSKEQLQTRRRAAGRAAKRRMRVFSVLLVSNVVMGALAAFGVVAWPYVAIPVGLTAVWLVACRLMVKSERRTVVMTGRVPTAPVIEAAPTDSAEGPLTEEILAVQVGGSAAEPATQEPADGSAEHEEQAEREPGSWDPVPSPLPTYVSKSPAPQRTVRTIDLDSTGVWTSGHTESDSKLAREAEESERTQKAQAESDSAERRRASGS